MYRSINSTIIFLVSFLIVKQFLFLFVNYLRNILKKVIFENIIKKQNRIKMNEKEQHTDENIQETSENQQEYIQEIEDFRQEYDSEQLNLDLFPYH